MTSTYHTPIAYGAAATGAGLEAPLGQLDAAIVALAASLGSTTLPITVTDAQASSGQKVVPVAATTGFLAGMSIWIGDVAGTFEIRVIDTIQAGVSVTVTVNLTNTYAAGKIVAGSPSEIVDARGTFATLAARLLANIGTGSALSGMALTPTSVTATGLVSVGGALLTPGIIQPAALTGDTNNWNPAGLSTCSGIIISTSGGTHHLTGLVAQPAGTRIRLFMDASGAVILDCASGSSSAGNQFLTAGSAAVTIRGFGSVDIISTQGYWWVGGV
jgi:hypothetical protein